MNPTLFTLILCCSLSPQAHGHPIDWIRNKLSTTARPDSSSWLWGWAWAADGSVSVVDRSPPLIYPARPASFGMELSDPLLGYVIPLSSFTAPCEHGNSSSSYPFIPDPVQGCPDLCVTGPHQPEPSETWIALVQRGGCPFVEKARQAQRLGAKAVVVGGDSDSPDILLNMYSEQGASDVEIAATFIKYWDYAELLALISSSNTSHAGLRTVSLLLSTEYSAWEWYSPIVTFVVILLLPSLLTFITLLIHRIRAARAAQRDRAPEDFVHRLPWRVWTGNGWEKHEAVLQTAEDPTEEPSEGPNRDLEQGAVVPSSSQDEAEDEPSWVDQQMECAICLEMFAKGDRVRVLPCKHFFHMSEVDEWLITKKKVCPVCKADITRPLPHHETPSHAHDSDTPHDDTSPPAAAPTELTALLPSSA